MKLHITWLLLFLLLSMEVLTADPTPEGVEIALNEDTLLKVQQEYFPGIMDSIQKIKLPDKEFTYEPSAEILIKDIKMNFEPLKPENLATQLQENSTLLVKGNDIKAEGYLTAEFKNGILPKVSDLVKMKIHKFNVIIKMNLGLKPHPKNNKKNTINAVITLIEADMDFDFDLTGGVFSSVQNLFQEHIKVWLYDLFKGALQESILPIMNQRISDLIDEHPIYVPIMDTIVMDCSLLVEPKIENGLMIFYIDGKIVHRNDPNDKYRISVGSTAFPRIVSANKGAKILISSYTINTALYSMYYSSKLVFKQEIPNIIDVIPDKKQGFFDLYNPFSNGLKQLLKKRYGERRRGLVEFTFSKLPQIKIEDSKISSNVEIKIAFSAEKNEKYDVFNGYLVDLSFEANAGVSEEGKINGTIEKIKVNKFTLLYNNLGKELDFHVERQIINWGINIARDIINDLLSLGYNNESPSFKDMNFFYSQVVTQSDHIEYDLELSFSNKKKKVEDKSFNELS